MGDEPGLFPGCLVPVLLMEVPFLHEQGEFIQRKPVNVRERKPDYPDSESDDAVYASVTVFFSEESYCFQKRASEIPDISNTSKSSISSSAEA